MRHIKKAISLSVAGGLGLTVLAGLSGCEQPQPPSQSTDALQDQSRNWFLVIEQTGSNPDTYRVVEQHPTTGPTRAVLRDLNGIERFLSPDELKAIAEQEAMRVEQGTSRLAQDGAQLSSGGLSLGEVLLATAAGSLLGGMLANSLMRNRNFQQNTQRYNSTRPSRPPTSLRTGTARQPRTGFFGSRGSSGARPGSFSFGG